MTMEERDQWEEMAKRNKRRRLNQAKLATKWNDTDPVMDKATERELSLSCSDGDFSDSSQSFEAICFENDEQLDQGLNFALSSSEDDEEDELKTKQKEAEKQDQIDKLVRIPKKMQRQRSHLDLIKAARKWYIKHKQLPMLEDFMEEQDVTKKRAKRAIGQVMRENNLDPSMLRRRAKEQTESESIDIDQISNDDDHKVDEVGGESGDGITANRQLKRQQDDSSDDYSDDDEMNESLGDKQLKLLNLPPDAGKYPFDSAVEKTMLRLLNCLKQFRI